MYCEKCGAELNDEIKFCKKCGAQVKRNEIEDNKPEENQMNNNEMPDASYGKDACNVTVDQGEKNIIKTEFKENRNALIIMLLSILTCGIYSVYYYSTVIRDVNYICEEDGKTTPGVVKFILLSMITAGIYGIYWNYKVCMRTENYQNTHWEETGITIKPALSGTAYILWTLLGSLLFGAGPIIAFCLFTRNMNNISKIYNKTNAASDRIIPAIDKKPIIIIVAIMAGVMALNIIGTVALSNASNDIAMPAEDEIAVDDFEDVEDELIEDEPGETYDTDYYSITLPAAFNDFYVVTSEIDDDSYGYACGLRNKETDDMICALDLIPEALESEYARIDGVNADAVGTMEVPRVNGFIIYVYYYEESEYASVPGLENFSYDEYLQAIVDLVYSMEMTDDSGEINFY